MKQSPLRKFLTPKMNKYFFHKPTIKQAIALLLYNKRDLFYGGAARSGKSDFLLMAALQWVEHSHYSAIIFRNTYTEGLQRKSIVDKSHEWLSGTDAVWLGDAKMWRFPSGATVAMGYIDGANGHYRYKSSEYHFVGFEEITAFPKEQALYLFSRQSRAADDPVPLMFRTNGNPDGVYAEWVYDRYVNPETRKPGTVFIPANIYDNPYVNAEEYIESLAMADEDLVKILVDGDWSMVSSRKLFSSRAVKTVNELPGRMMILGRFWDLAANDGRGDYLAGVKMCRLQDGRFVVLDVIEKRLPPDMVEDMIVETARFDGQECLVWVEQEPNASGKIVATQIASKLARVGSISFPFKSTNKKEFYAGLFAIPWNRGHVMLLDGTWNQGFVDQLAGFTKLRHDDMVDAASKCYACIINAANYAASVRERTTSLAEAFL